MSIPSHLHDVNRRLGNLERCAEMAPEGTFERSKAAAEAVGDATDAVMAALRDAGFVATNNDAMRAVQATIYGYLLQGNPDESELHVAEGFGENVDGPAGTRMIEQLESSRDQVASLRMR